MSPASWFRSGNARLALPAVGLAYVLAVVLAYPRSDSVSTYGSVSKLAVAADLVAGLGLIAAGILAWLDRSQSRLGALALLAGIAWFGADLEGWEGGPTVVRSLGAVIWPFVLPLLVHLVLAFPAGRLRSRVFRAAVVGLYALAAVVSLGRALVRDPYLDPYCWRTCSFNSFLIRAEPNLARALDDAWMWTALAAGLLLAAIAVWRLATATRPARRVLWRVEVPGDLVGLAVAAYAAALLETRLEDPRNAEFRSIYYALSFSVGALAAGLAWSVVRARATRAAVSRLAADLGEAPRPGTLQSTLSSAVGDPTLEVAYWLPASGRYVDGGGQSVWAPFAGSGRAVTPIVRDGRPVALVAHAADLLESTALPEEIGSTARLAVDNERLQAEVLAQLGDLRASRARIVEKADAERCRLERNLHDGAQQRLLALSYDLRLARAGAQADGAAGIAAALGSAAGEAQTALLELRDLAHGIYPAVLAEGGLGPALATVADTSSIAVELGEVATERLPVPVETTAYVTVLETIVDAEARGATFVGVDVRRDADRLVVALDDDGAPRSRRPIHVADRVGALGGRIELGPSSLQAELPCE